MKVHIGPYYNWIGPYQIAEKILFWKDKYEDRAVHNLGEKLSEIKWLVSLCKWIDSKKQRTIKVRIDHYDVWNLDSTLAHIVHPALVKLREDKGGAPFVDDEDVPEELRSTSAPPKKNEWDTDDNHFKRWDYVLDEMIFAFESKNNDWEDNYSSYDDCRAVEERIQNGFRLFGKYYQALWT